MPEMWINGLGQRLGSVFNPCLTQRNPVFSGAEAGAFNSSGL